MTETYKKVGRGGAGNFYSKEDIETATQATPSTLESQTATSSTTNDNTPSLPPPEYQHTGRGGAGNWVQPSTLPTPVTDPNSTSLAPSSTAINPSSNTPNIPTRTSSQAPALPATYHGGRGGAGNYSWRDYEAEKKRKEEEERVREEAIRRGVEGSVDGGLTKPGRAARGGGFGEGRERVGM
ncbi:hypothetical protein BJ875DRAFT_380403 [Amylocarpus encephaloides]|uniref:Uncharacterized protein n=1 Tax=Amylocarpus encephaloides TaxID=45428 RepID=A0A9P7YF95_9HELO|nr:hypothetical protein BJ875DRAFT_380403 [Amylocarpus encephaloides]